MGLAVRGILSPAGAVTLAGPFESGSPSEGGLPCRQGDNRYTKEPTSQGLKWWELVYLLGGFLQAATP